MSEIPVDDFEFKPLSNFLRAVREEEVEPTSRELEAILRRRGFDSTEVASEIESRVSALVKSPRPVRSRTIREWRHPSVRAFAEGGDPIEKMVALAANLAFTALERALTPGIVDPFELAALRHIPVVPNDAIGDARLVPLPGDRLQIEFNPKQPKSRTRFSVAHELAHTFFQDCRDAIRNRQARAKFGPHEWELEMLCNIGAAELLMPVAAFHDMDREALNIAALMDQKERLEVSAEALLARVARITSEPCAMFAASKIEEGDSPGRYRIDYAMPSRSWLGGISVAGLLPKQTVVAECTAIGFTSTGDETWPGVGALHVECAGVLPYRHASFPRVVGIVHPRNATSEPGVRIVYVRGDATLPRGTGVRILAHNVNDKAVSWGFGFARAVASKWPEAEAAFRNKVFKDKSLLRLGNTFYTEVEDNLWTFQMVCQHGYGGHGTSRIRYAALKSCLEELVRFASDHNATVHMPRLGTGYGGAKWEIVADIVDATVCGAGIPVMVYDLPNAKTAPPEDMPDLFSRNPTIA